MKMVLKIIIILGLVGIIGIFIYSSGAKPLPPDDTAETSVSTEEPSESGGGFVEKVASFIQSITGGDQSADTPPSEDPAVLDLPAAAPTRSAVKPSSAGQGAVLKPPSPKKNPLGKSGVGVGIQVVTPSRPIPTAPPTLSPFSNSQSAVGQGYSPSTPASVPTVVPVYTGGTSNSAAGVYLPTPTSRPSLGTGGVGVGQP